MPKKFTQKQILIIAGGAVIVIVLLVLVYFNIRPKSGGTGGGEATLTVWGTDDVKVFQLLADSYSKYRTGVKVNYTKVDPAGYEDKIVRALAAGTGPDVFEIGDRGVPRWRAVLAPMPTSSFAQLFDVVKLESYFPTVVGQDFVSNGEIYGLPLYIDTLAMIYNKDIFDSAGIALPPKTWEEFQNDVLKLRQLNDQGQIVRAAAAIGGSANSVKDAPDILSLFMLQNGTEMTNKNLTAATFGAQGGSGVSAFNFYLQFANAASPYYTWNDSLGDAEQAFVQEKTAILFDYQAALRDIKAKAPFLNVGVAPMPQPKGATIFVNYPKYDGLVVSKAGNTFYGWDFVLYLTTYAEGESIYLSTTGKPPAQRPAIAQQAGNPDTSIFATQALTARSWYQADDEKVDAILSDAIANVLGGISDSTKALRQAQESVSQLMGR